MYLFHTKQAYLLYDDLDQYLEQLCSYNQNESFPLKLVFIKEYFITN